MNKVEFRFANDAVEGSKEQWATVLSDGLKVVYTKTSGGEVFLYSCRRIIGDAISEISCETPEDLSQKQVELLPRFVDFLAGIV